MRLLKKFITSIKRNKPKDIEVRETLVQIAERNSTIELEREHRGNIKEWQRISNIIEYASRDKIRIRACELTPILYEPPLGILPDERVEIAQLIEKYYREKEKELIEKIKPNINYGNTKDKRPIRGGDWVMCEGKIYQLTSISNDGEVELEFDDEHNYRCRGASVDDLEPIPITAEILEKKGLFRHERDDDNPQRIVLSNHFIMARTYEDVEWWRVLIYDEELPSKDLFNGIIYSVHQLQHALRLAGVEKEINL